jgi:cation transport regulator ChaC
MNKIGILAYGSLIEDPGIEMKPLISKIINDVRTPFNIELARTSRLRDGAPTVVPVESYGAPVQAVILVLHESVEIENAKDMLWRRETRNEKTNKHYKKPTNPSSNQVVVAEISELGGIDLVLYTKIGANIDNPTPEKLANLAIKSARGKAGLEGKDGISYLIDLKKQNINTPLMSRYEEEVLKLVGASSLSEALNIVQTNKLNP